jgi:hypothetical protein
VLSGALLPMISTCCVRAALGAWPARGADAGAAGADADAAAPGAEAAAAGIGAEAGRAGLSSAAQVSVPGSSPSAAMAERTGSGRAARGIEGVSSLNVMAAAACAPPVNAV